MLNDGQVGLNSSLATSSFSEFASHQRAINPHFSLFELKVAGDNRN